MRERRAWGKFVAFVQLGKLRIVELWVGLPLAWSLLTAPQDGLAASFVLLALALLAIVCTIAAALALDDVGGLRDGIDLANHGAAGRYAVRKPLLDGRLTEREALAFAAVMATIAVGALGASTLIAPAAPWWLPLLWVAVLVMAVNYSVGLKLSYVGGCELINLVATGATLIFPFALISGSVTAIALAESLLIGLWMVQIVVFSNSQDAAGDRAGQRMTVAARASAAGNRRFIVAVFAVSVAVAGGSIVVGVLPWWFALVLTPAWAAQVVQLRCGLARADWLAARRLGFRAFRLGALGLLVGNLIHVA